MSIYRNNNNNIFAAIKYRHDQVPISIIPERITRIECFVR